MGLFPAAPLSLCGPTLNEDIWNPEQLNRNIIHETNRLAA